VIREYIHYSNNILVFITEVHHVMYNVHFIMDYIDIGKAIAEVVIDSSAFVYLCI